MQCHLPRYNYCTTPAHRPPSHAGVTDGPCASSLKIGLVRQSTGKPPLATMRSNSARSLPSSRCRTGLGQLAEMVLTTPSTDAAILIVSNRVGSRWKVVRALRKRAGVIVSNRTLGDGPGDSLVDHVKQRPREKRPTDHRRRRWRLTLCHRRWATRRCHPAQQCAQLGLLLDPAPVAFLPRRDVRPPRQHPRREPGKVVGDEGEDIDDPIPRLPFLRLPGIHPDME